MTVGKAIFYLLDNSTDLTAIVGTRIYPEVAQQDAPLPYVVYNISNNEPSDTKREPSKMDTANIEVNCYSTSYTQVIDMSVAVRAALDRVTGTYSGVNVQSIAYMNEVIDFDEGQRAYNVSSDYDVRISRTDFEIAQGSPITGVDLGDLADVNTTGVTDGQVIAYDAATAVWLPATDAGGAEQLNDLSDVIISLPASGEFFRYDGDEWVNDTANKSDVGLGNVDNTSDANKPISTATQTALDLKADITSVPTELDDLNDVQIIGTPTLGQALVYGAGKWLPGAAGATDLGDLDDVNTTGAAFGSLLTYNGASWDISGSQLPTDDIYFHQRYETESEALRTGATATTELYFTCTAQGNGLAESASSDTPTAGKIIKRKIYYSEEGFADPDTGTWVEFTPAPADDASFATVKAALLEYLKARTGGTVPISLKQTWEEVAAAPTFTGLLNETYGSGAAAAYGTRRLNGNYSGACMTIRRASDGTTQTIGFVGEEIDESAITNFCTGTTCTVQVWHDQSQTGGTGSGNDAEQTTPANQPTIYTGGQLVKEGGRLAVDFDGVSENFTSTITNVSQSFDIYTVHNFNTTPTATQRLYDSDNGGRITRGSNGTSNNFAFAGTVLSWSPQQTGQVQETTVYNGVSSLVRVNGTQVASGDAGTNSTGTDLVIGADKSGTTQYIDGQLQEIIIFDNSKSTTDRTDIEGNISAYYQSAKLLDESYGSGAEAAYSVRQLKRDNTECMVIRRASDSTTTTIGFDASGNISEADIISFCTGTTCTVYQWLDQSGNGNTATAGATEPIIYTGGAIVKDNGKVAINFNAAYSALKYTGQDLNLSAVTALVVQRIDTTTSVGGYPIALQNTNNDGLRMFLRNYGLRNRTTGTNLDVSFPQELYFTRNLADIASSTSALKATFNGAVTATASGKTFSTNGLDLAVGGSSYDTVKHTGSMQEAIIFGVDKYTSGDIGSIRENVGDYFTQNTPLLDTYSGAAAAYSLRLLDSTYTGSAIRVRRSSDNAEQDIGFNVFGELDTVSLLAFAGTGDAFVKVWYDQASTNDATQTDTASQPQIVSSGAVIVENGKPAVQFSALFSLDMATRLTQVQSNFSVRENITTGASVDFLYGDISTYDYHAGGTNNYLDTLYSSTDVRNGSNFVNGQSQSFTTANTATTSSVLLSMIHLSNTARISQICQDRSRSNRSWNGKIQEILIYESDQSGTPQAGIETNINTFYNIY